MPVPVCVRTTPGHGPDDYVIGQKYGLETANPVGPDGTYLPGTYPTLDGVNVFKANDIVVALLQEKGALLHVEKMQHSYPCCWRHKTPIIFRATPQWFVSIDQKQPACAVTERDQRRAVNTELGPGAYRVDGC